MLDIAPVPKNAACISLRLNYTVVNSVYV